MNDPVPMPSLSSLSPSNHPKSGFFTNPLTYILGICFLITALLVILVFHNNQSPIITPPTRPPLPKSNGFDALKAAAEKAADKDDVSDAISRTPKRKWSLAKKKKLVADNRRALEAAHAGLALPYLEENSFNIQYSQYAKLRDLARVMVLAGNVALETHQPRVAVANYLDAITLGRHVPHRSLAIGRLMGIGSEALGRRRLWESLNQMDEETARYCLQRLETLQADKLPLAVTCEEEKYYAQSTTLNFIEHPERDALISQKNAVLLRIYTTIVSRKMVIQAIGDYMDAAIRQSNQPYPIGKQPIPLPGEMIAKEVVPDFVQLDCKYTVNEAGDALLRTALALRIYRLRTGTNPPDLSTLVSTGILKTVPLDPFAVSSPLQYHRGNSGDFVLYSIGPDSVDDHGKGIVGKSAQGKIVRYATKNSIGDMTAGWYPY